MTATTLSVREAGMIEFIPEVSGQAITIRVDGDNTIVISQEPNGQVSVLHYNLTRRVREITMGNGHHFGESNSQLKFSKASS